MSENFIEGLFDGESCELQHLNVDIQCAYAEKGEAVIPDIEKSAEIFKDIAEVAVLELYKIDEDYGAFTEVFYRLITNESGELKSKIDVEAIKAAVKLKGAKVSAPSNDEDPSNPAMVGGMLNGLRQRFVHALPVPAGPVPVGARAAPQAIVARYDPRPQIEMIQNQINAAIQAMGARIPPPMLQALITAMQRLQALRARALTPENMERLQRISTTAWQLTQSFSHFAWTNYPLLFQNDSVREEEVLSTINWSLFSTLEEKQYRLTKEFYENLIEMSRNLPAGNARRDNGIRRIEAIMRERTRLHDEIGRSQANPFSRRVLLRSALLATRRIVFWSLFVVFGPRVIVNVIEYGVEYALIPGLNFVLRDAIAFLLSYINETASTGWKQIYDVARSGLISVLFGGEIFGYRIEGLLTRAIPGVGRSIAELYTELREKAISGIFSLIMMIPASLILKGSAAVWLISFFISMVYYMMYYNGIEQGRMFAVRDQAARDRLVEATREAANINAVARRRQGQVQAQQQPFVTALGNIFYGGKRKHTRKHRKQHKKRKYTRKH